MTNQTYKNSILLCICILVVGGIFLYFLSTLGKLNTSVKISSAPTPTSIPLSPQVKEMRYPSSDGKKVLIVKTTKTVQDTTTYTFSVSTQATLSGHMLFKKSIKAPTTLTVPFNAWSPDNQYFFIQEHVGAKTTTFVYKASGQPFADGETSHNVTMLFAEKETTHVLKEVTGWAAPTLLLINTKSIDTEKDGPSFWFDVTKDSVTRLSTSFQ